MNPKKTLLSLGIVIWAFSVAAGFVWVSDYSSRPGRFAVAPQTLQSSDPPKMEAKLPKLLLFLHPYCTCSRATLAELTRLTARTEGLLEVRIFFYLPDGRSPDWAETDTWRQASAIPNVTVATMNDAEMQRFGALTSGQSLLYGRDGQLVFSGGITISRGHEGSNAGITSIETYLKTGQTGTSRTPVFGCILTNGSSQ